MTDHDPGHGPGDEHGYEPGHEGERPAAPPGEPTGPAFDLPAPDALEFPHLDAAGEAAAAAAATTAYDASVAADAADAAGSTPADGNAAEPPVVDPGVTEGRAARRRAAEAAARDDADLSRRRVLTVAVTVAAVLAVLAVLGGSWALLSRASEDDGQAQPTVSPTITGPKQPTLLISVSDKEGIAVDSALTSIGGSTPLANFLTISPNTLVDAPTGGTLPFGEVNRLPDADASANALSDAIGVTVNGTWAMDKLAFSGLVDAVGGIVLDVDTDVLVEQPDGTTIVLVPAGQHQLVQGPQAAAYATYLGPGEPEASRTARFAQVLRLTLSKLPNDATKMESILSGLGASARSTVPSSDLATYLVKLHEYALADNVAYNALPTVPADSGGTVQGERIDQKATAEMVAKYFSDALRTPGPNSKVRVLVQNGVGTPGLNTEARQRLVDAGFTYVNGGNAPSFGVAATQVIVPDASAESLQRGADVAKALGVPSTSVVVATSGQNIADVVVVLGADFTVSPSPS